MIKVLHASHNGELYKRWISSVGDIADLIRENNLETLTSDDGRIDFWFTPSIHHGYRRINRKATEILLATTRFSASDVPLLRGNIILTAHSPAGELVSLTDEQSDTLAHALDEATWWQDLVLSWRCNRDQRRQNRADQANNAHLLERIFTPDFTTDGEPGGPSKDAWNSPNA